MYSIISFYFWKMFWSLVCTIIQAVGAGISTLMSIFYGLGSWSFRPKIEGTWLLKGEMDGYVFISRQSRHLSFVDNMIRVLFRICTLTWRVCRQGKGIYRRKKSTNIGMFCIVETAFYPLHLSYLSLKTISLLNRKVISCREFICKI